MASTPQLPLPPTLAELEQLLLLIGDAKTTSYFAVAALTFLIYDHILSLDKEIEFIWKRCTNLSFASYIYIWWFYVKSKRTGFNLNASREMIPSDPFSFSCQIYTQFEGISSTLIAATIDLILLMRVWILFGKSRRMMYFLVPLMIVEIGVMLFISIFTIMNADKYVHVGPILPGCYSYTVPKLFTVYPVPSLLVTFTMFVMTVYNCKTRLGLDFSSRNTMPLVNLFLRDGIYWFLAIVAVNPPQIILWSVARATLTELLVIPSIVVYSIIGSRVLLNILELMLVNPHRDPYSVGTISTTVANM
ncbi:hypothetical protein DFH08DRAFT_961950 [Mycena albidolilacea]|uniref:DUF6533 domain-containing protein n=1 Tax=Mycena albidolilacea TaxID=1033008 RepID=A0AAD7EP28_9AGAR|nr:hypothetical protein DFH08DRAFT_961950 [Mycena albidolilacea]